MATARDRHYDTRSVRLVTPLVVAGLAPAMPQQDAHPRRGNCKGKATPTMQQKQKPIEAGEAAMSYFPVGLPPKYRQS